MEVCKVSDRHVVSRCQLHYKSSASHGPFQMGSVYHQEVDNRNVWHRHVISKRTFPSIRFSIVVAGHGIWQLTVEGYETSACPVFMMGTHEWLFTSNVSSTHSNSSMMNLAGYECGGDMVQNDRSQSNMWIEISSISSNPWIRVNPLFINSYFPVIKKPPAAIVVRKSCIGKNACVVQCSGIWTSWDFHNRQEDPIHAIWGGNEV